MILRVYVPGYNDDDERSDNVSDDNESNEDGTGGWTNHIT